jgi:hypothetical protein
MYDNDLRAPKAFRSLFVDGLSLDQLWEELQLQNEPALRFLEGRVSSLVYHQDDIELLPPAKKQKRTHPSFPEESDSGDSVGSFDSLESLDSEGEEEFSQFNKIEQGG